MSLKTIQMDPTHLKITKTKRTKKTIIPPSVMVNQPNLRQILLDKLMKHRKTQKRSVSDPLILNNDFDDQCSFTEPQNPSVPVHSGPVHAVPVHSGPFEPIQVEAIPVQVSTVMQDKPYGVLKNGLKPTFKTWNKSQKNIQYTQSAQPVQPVQSQSVLIEPVQVSILPDKKEVSTEVSKEGSNEGSKVSDKIQTPLQKCPIKVGKSKKNKTVQIWIACHKTRKARSEEQDTIRKTSLSTVKNYLKNHKLIKVGSTAPTNLIRQIYENAKSYGDVTNENKQNLLYNYEKDTEP
jgi:hypothetical protein